MCAVDVTVGRSAKYERMVSPLPVTSEDPGPVKEPPGEGGDVQDKARRDQ